AVAAVHGSQNTQGAWSGHAQVREQTTQVTASSRVGRVAGRVVLPISGGAQQSVGAREVRASETGGEVVTQERHDQLGCLLGERPRGPEPGVGPDPFACGVL